MRTYSTTLWKTFVVVVAATATLVNLWGMSNWRRALDPDVAGTLAVTLSDGKIVAFGENSPVEKAGARIGDTLLRDRFTNLYTYQRALGTDEQIGMTIVSPNQAPKHVDVRPIPRADFDSVEAVLTWVGGFAVRLAGILFALLMGLRRKTTLEMRGLVLAFLLHSVWARYFLPAGLAQEFLSFHLLNWATTVPPVAFLFFALRFPKLKKSPWKWPVVRLAFWILLCVFIWTAIQYELAYVGGVAWVREASPFGQPSWQFALLVCQFLTVSALYWNWRHLAGSDKRRAAWIGTALGAPLVLLRFVDYADIPHVYSFIDLVNFFSYCGLTYGIIRHQIFDFGIALNRLLSITLIAAVLVGAAFVLQATVSPLLDITDRAQSLFLDALTATLLLALYRPVRRWVVKTVHAIFYPEWLTADVALDRATADAALLTDRQALLQHYQNALHAYTGGACSAVYELRDGTFLRMISDMPNAPDVYTPNPSETAQLMGDKLPAKLQDAAGENAIVAPFGNRDRLDGFVVLGGKPDFNRYRHKEAGNIAHAANLLGHDLQALAVRENQLLLQTQSQMRLLQAQIEPHFLYNTLASVQHLVRRAPAEADDLLTHLIRYLRHAMPKMRTMMSTLEQEFGLAASFLHIARMRLGDRLSVNVDLPHALKKQAFPPLVIQTLVENALKHGVEQKQGSVHISVIGALEDGHMVVSVTDNGVGLGRSKAEPGGTGLANTRDRLHAIYGDGAQLRVTNLPQGGVCASIRIETRKTEQGN